MTVSEKRILLTRLIAGLINKAIELGYQPALDQVKRTQEEAAHNAADGTGIKNSLHLLGLAVDLLLFKNGLYLFQADNYRELGAWWKQQHELARWGGDFHSVDADHFSIEHNGVR